LPGVAMAALDGACTDRRSKDTGFKLTDEHRTRLAGMHARDETGALARVEFEIPQDPEFQMGGGGLYGTASDYLAFQRVFLN